MLETLSFAENVGRNRRQDSLQSLDLQDFTAFCDFIRATQSCRQGVDRPPSLALRRLVWVDRAECVVASSPCRLLCTWNSPNRAMALPPFVVTRVCVHFVRLFALFRTILYHKLDQSAAWAGAWTKFQRSLSKLILPFGSPPWQVLIISAIPKGFLSSAAKVCACLFWIGWKQLRLQCVLCISICEISWLRGTVSYIFLSVPFFQSLTSNSFLEDLCDICIFLRHWFLCVLLVMYRNVPHLYVLYFKLELRGGFSIHRQPWQSVFQHIATTLLPWMTCAKGLGGSSKRAGHE